MTPNAVYVGVEYRDLTDTEELPPPGSECVYTFQWACPAPPFVGCRVIVPAVNELKPGIVVEVGVTARHVRELTSSGIIIKRVAWIATDNEIAEAQRKRLAWISAGCVAAGLPPRTQPFVTAGAYPAVPPATGFANPQTAHQYGSVWWKLHKTAEQIGDQEASDAFLKVAKYWYAQDGNKSAPVVAAAVVPPGWYPDPVDHMLVRWWDGQRWTGHIHPV